MSFLENETLQSGLTKGTEQLNKTKQRQSSIIHEFNRREYFFRASITFSLPSSPHQNLKTEFYLLGVTLDHLLYKIVFFKLKIKPTLFF